MSLDMDKVSVWVRQPTTLGAAAILVGGLVYWTTGNSEAAIGAAGLFLGAVDDNTAKTLASVELIEDSIKAGKTDKVGEK